MALVLSVAETVNAVHPVLFFSWLPLTKGGPSETPSQVNWTWSSDVPNLTTKIEVFTGQSHSGSSAELQDTAKADWVCVTSRKMSWAASCCRCSPTSTLVQLNGTITGERGGTPAVADLKPGPVRCSARKALAKFFGTTPISSGFEWAMVLTIIRWRICPSCRLIARATRKQSCCRRSSYTSLLS